ncbi:MAG: BON domain-containing protein [Pirellula sp.]|jgi:hyperosmotically inducible protein
MKFLPILFLLSLAIFGCDTAPNKPASTDNSSINQRDNAESAKTPMDQYENQKDVDTTAKIRRQVVDTKMSINAQNVKIMTQNGKVTLRGPVESADERTQIEIIARNVAGEKNVDNKLDITSPK